VPIPQNQGRITGNDFSAKAVLGRRLRHKVGEARAAGALDAPVLLAAVVGRQSCQHIRDPAADLSGLAPIGHFVASACEQMPIIRNNLTITCARLLHKLRQRHRLARDLTDPPSALIEGEIPRRGRQTPHQGCRTGRCEGWPVGLALNPPGGSWRILVWCGCAAGYRARPPKLVRAHCGKHTPARRLSLWRGYLDWNHAEARHIGAGRVDIWEPASLSGSGRRVPIRWWWWSSSPFRALGRG
jgi:hypothetical protein